VSISTHFLPRRCVSLDASGRLQQERLRFAMLPPSGSFEKAETRQQRWPTEQEHASSLSLSLSHFFSCLLRFSSQQHQRRSGSSPDGSLFARACGRCVLPPCTLRAHRLVWKCPTPVQLLPPPRRMLLRAPVCTVAPAPSPESAVGWPPLPLRRSPLRSARPACCRVPLLRPPVLRLRGTA